VSDWALAAVAMLAMARVMRVLFMLSSFVY
jgi:hypothetical protein